MINDGRRGEQNTHSNMAEHIYTIGVDFTPKVAATLTQVWTRLLHNTAPN